MSVFPSRNFSEAAEGLNKLLDEIGLPLVMRASDMPPLAFVSSGIPEIDAITGGFPRKRITEIFGPKGVGKTSLMSRIIPSGLKTLYVDTENAMVSDRENVSRSDEYILENVADIVEKALGQGFDLVVVDSVAAMTCKAELEGVTGSALWGIRAKLMSQWMRKINFYLSKSDTAVVFINQQRDSMDPYGPRTYTPGGKALGYAASLRLELKSNKVDRLEGGQWVHVEVEKSRVCKPYQKIKFKLEYA